MHSIRTLGMVFGIKRQAGDTAATTSCHIDILSRCRDYRGYSLHSNDPAAYRRGVIFPPAISNPECCTPIPEIRYCTKYYKLIIQDGDFEFKCTRRSIPLKAKLERECGGYVE